MLLLGVEGASVGGGRAQQQAGVREVDRELIHKPPCSINI